jgi:tryptophan-rich sensory protein
VVLWLLIAATIVAFSRHSRVAAALLVPYLAWVTFASALTFAVWRLNPTLLG